MSDTPRRDGPPQQPYGNQGGGDPAYQYPPPQFGDPNQSPTHAAPRPQPGFHEQPTYPPTYQSPADANPTQQLPANYEQGGYQQGGYQQGGYQQSGYDSSQYSQYGQPPPNQYGGQQPWSDGSPPEPPDSDEPGSRMWLWAIAGVAVLLVIGLVVAVFIVNSSSQETVVAPPIQPSASATTTTPRTTTSRAPAPTPSDTSTSETSGTSAPGVTEQVVYNVTGDGKALNITYIDEGGGFQTEFNVTLPWTKTVQLAQPAKDTASVSIVKLGGEVSCTITVAGAQVSTRSGRGVTMCRSDS
jgi:hypothetical protein